MADTTLSVNQEHRSGRAKIEFWRDGQQNLCLTVLVSSLGKTFQVDFDDFSNLQIDEMIDFLKASKHGEQQ